MSPVALVTGGAVRAGRAITLALADAGYGMVVNYHSSEEAARSLEVELTRQGREVLLASRGSIVNLADHMGLKPWVRYAHHSIAKAGLVHLTRIQAVALAPE